jgi:hypothetical protein
MHRSAERDVKGGKRSIHDAKCILILLPSPGSTDGVVARQPVMSIVNVYMLDWGNSGRIDGILPYIQSCFLTCVCNGTLKLRDVYYRHKSFVALHNSTFTIDGRRHCNAWRCQCDVTLPPNVSNISCCRRLWSAASHENCRVFWQNMTYRTYSRVPTDHAVRKQSYWVLIFTTTCLNQVKLFSCPAT